MDQAIFLIGSITAIVMEGYKYLVAKYGQEATRRSIYLGVFAVALVWTALTQTNIVSMEAADTFVKMVMTAVSVYEVIIKTLKNIVSSYGSQNSQGALPQNSTPTNSTSSSNDSQG